MGFTRYWTREEKPLTKEFVNKVRQIIAENEEKGIELAGWDGNGTACVTEHLISFNGKGDNSHETFILNNNFEWDEFQRRHGWEGYAFCKTARKPYDAVVKRILEEAQKDGFVKDVSSDEE